ncbi:MAG: pantoate--beta-alanine ligase [Actinomycetota bacterium]|nr:pantoate--beta-alanine ligase [Actinomycetota bacterium]
MTAATVPDLPDEPTGRPAAVFTLLSEYASALDNVRAGGRTVGFVPTMGALHAGHQALVARAASECDVVAVSIFVNPLQFGDPDDLERYPRYPDADVMAAGDAGATFVLMPEVAEMYPAFPAPVPTAVTVSGLADRWEGAARPGHFSGVATVVAKLFAITGRCRAYFGEKDYQQLAVVRRMANDLSFPVEVVGCPTVRDDDGLALSSRNVRLSPDERRAAAVIPQALAAGARAITEGEYRPSMVEALMSQVIAEEPAVELDYAVVVDGNDLTPAIALRPDRPLRLLLAARVGGVRLIDNLDPAAGSNGIPAPQRSVSYAATPINPTQPVMVHRSRPVPAPAADQKKEK